MGLTTAQIAHYYKIVDPPVRSYLRLMLVEALSPQQRLVLDLIEEQGGLTATIVAEEMEIRINHAGNLLKALVEIGLLNRRAVSDPEGLYYYYEVKNDIE
jgi:predicted transcriptional regulator